MACNLVTNRARSLRSLMDQGIIDENQNVLEEANFNYANVETTKEMENVIGSKLPNDVFAFGMNVNFVTANDELFQRADAAENIIYPENAQYRNNYQYPIQENKGNNLTTKLTDLLSNIGVSVESLTTNHKFKNIEGVADTFNKVVYTSLNPAEVSSLPEEAAHMFVEFIEQNEPKLFNKMMSDIPKYGIYQSVKDEYLPIYSDINKVKKEAIGKAISEYIVGGKVDKNIGQLRQWFNEVLTSLRKALASFGILTEADYNNYFEYTADNILKGSFKGTFKGESDIYFNINATTPIGKLDAINEQLELRPVKKNGVDTTAYFFRGKEVKNRVTEKIRDKNKIQKEPTEDQIKASEYGTRGHADLDALWKIKTGILEASTVIPQTSPTVFAKLSNFVDIVYDQFPGAEIRTEVKIYDEKTDTGGTIDFIAIEPDGTVNILDNKFLSGKYTTIPENYEKQLAEYKRILRNNYGFTKFGQVRVVPFQTKYSGKLENKIVTDIDFGTNSYIDIEERSHLNPLPASFELTKDERINRALQGLEEELNKVKNNTPVNEAEQIFKDTKIKDIKETIAKLQITKDITSLETLAGIDQRRMEYILQKANASPDELWELYELRNHYAPYIEKKYNIDNDGNRNVTLTNISDYAQEIAEEVDLKLEPFFNSHDIDINKANKPISWWSRLKQLSDFDHPAFQALQRILNKGFSQNEIKIRKEYEEIKSIISQVFKETGKTGIEAYSNILQKKNGKLTNKLIPKLKKEWYDMHKSIYNDVTLRNKLNKYFNKEAYDKYYQELKDDYIQRHRGLEGKIDPKTGKDILEQRLSFLKNNTEKTKGIGNPASKFFTVPDEFHNEDYLKYIKNAPDTGLARLYNKYVTINDFANKNSDANIALSQLPYIKKSTIEMLANDGFSLKNLTNNILDKLKLYEWESYDIDSKGQKVYKIPLKYKGTQQIQEDQSYDLGEMLLLWTDSVYQNAYLQEINTTTKLFQLALKKSKQIAYDNNGKPILENGELRTVETSQQALSQFQEYLNLYLFGVTDEGGDYDIFGLSRNKIVKNAMKYLSGNAIGLNVFSGFANLMGGTAQLVSVGAKNAQYTNKQLFKTIRNLHDPKMRALFSLMDITNSQFKRERANDLSANKLDSFVTWDKLFVLQQGGDWLVQNAALGAMAQNYTVKNNKIVKKEEGDKSLVELLDFDKDRKIVINGLDLSQEENYLELLKFREKVRRVGSEINGSTSEQDKFLLGNTLFGQLMLQFRRWLLPMATSRFGNLSYNQNLESYQIGKFRSLWNTIATKKIFDAAKEYLIHQNSASFESILFDLYNKALVTNPDNLSYEEFKKLYIQNMHSTFAEVGILALIVALRGWMDDEEDKDLGDRIVDRGLARTASELSFWYSSDSFLSIIRTPIPLLGLVTDAVDFLGAGTSSAYDAVFHADEDIEVKDKFLRMVPGINAFNRMLDDLEKD